MFIFFLFGLFWIVAFFIAIQIFVTCCVTCMWYFYGQDSDMVENMDKVSIKTAVKWAFSYHLGSLAFGAFLVAVVTMIRVICEYVMWQYEKSGGADKDSSIWKAIKCCVRSTTKCLDTCVKYINKNAYVQIALHNSSFCKAAQESFYLNIRNGGRFTAVAMIGGILGLLGKGTIVGSCTFLTIVLVDAIDKEVEQPYLPAMIIAFFSYMVAGVFLSLFQDSALTILHCFCLDEEQGGGKNTPEELLKFIDVADNQAKIKENGNASKPNPV